MKIKKIFFSLICILSITSISSNAFAKRIDTAPMLFTIDPFLEIPGDEVGDGAISRLVRRHDSLAVNVETFDLEPGVYTAWMLIFNKPNKCAQQPCSFIPDLLTSGEGGEVNVETGAAAFRIGQDIVGEDGVLNLSSYLEKNGPELPGSLFGEISRPLTAQVNIIIKTHGDLVGTINSEIIENLVIQLHSVDGLCTFNFPNNPPPFCPDPQMAIHEGITKHPAYKKYYLYKKYKKYKKY